MWVAISFSEEQCCTNINFLVLCCTTVTENAITAESWMKEPWDSRYYFCNFLLVYNDFKIKFL